MFKPGTDPQSWVKDLSTTVGMVIEILKSFQEYMEEKNWDFDSASMLHLWSREYLKLICKNADFINAFVKEVGQPRSTQDMLLMSLKKIDESGKSLPDHVLRNEINVSRNVDASIHTIKREWENEDKINKETSATVSLSGGTETRESDDDSGRDESDTSEDSTKHSGDRSPDMGNSNN